MFTDIDVMKFIFKPEERRNIYNHWFDIYDWGIETSFSNETIGFALLSGLNFARKSESVVEVCLNTLASELRLLLVAELMEEES